MPYSSTTLIENKEELLRHLKSMTHAYHLSNLFFRDFHYAILSFAQSRGQKLTYGDAEVLAGLFIASLEKSDILKPVKPGSWMLNYPAFKKVSEKPAAPARPVAARQNVTPASATPKTAVDEPTAA